MTPSKGARIPTSNGVVIQLGSELAKGGEGTVFEVHGDSQHVAKVYRKPADSSAATKLEVMIRRQNADLSKISAWPNAVLKDGQTGTTVGFTMPRLVGFHELHELNSPKSRIRLFPDADWGFLVRTGLNTARAIAMLHSTGTVVGDINDRNALFNREGLVRFIDCDSFQVKAGNDVYHCRVGVPTHTPPELQGKNLESVVRSPNHDAFGLAVVIFQLLFLGRHPFAGVPTSRDLALHEAIQQRAYAYSTAKTPRLLTAPKNAILPSIAGPEMARLFEQAFTSLGDQQRPDAKKWIAVLGDLESNLIKCDQEQSHVYSRSLTDCPWCEYEGKIRSLVFVSKGPKKTQSTVSQNFNTSTSLSSPNFESANLVIPTLLGGDTRIPTSVEPFEYAKQAADRHVRRFWLALLVSAGLFVILWWLIGLSLIKFLLFAGISLFVMAQIGDSRSVSIERKRAEAELSQAAIPIRSLIQGPEYARLAALRNDYLRRHELLNRAMSQQALTSQEVERLVDARRRKLRDDYVSSSLIKVSVQPGIATGVGEQLTKTLINSGFRTANDINDSIRKLPGVGHVRHAAIMEWKLKWKWSAEQAFKRSGAERKLAEYKQELVNSRVRENQKLNYELKALQKEQKSLTDQINNHNKQLGEALTQYARAKASVDVLSVVWLGS